LPLKMLDVKVADAAVHNHNEPPLRTNVLYPLYAEHMF
jgi:hypothetical protein